MDDTWWVNPEQLDECQKDIVSLPAKGSFLVVGPPGSGKTNLLLLRASQVTLSGKPNIQLLVFTRTLQEFIARGGTNYSFSTDKIKTLSKWQREFLFENGEKAVVDDDAGFEKQRDSLLKQVLELVRKKNIKAVYDVLFVDEAQDYNPEELELFCHLSHEVFFVADSRQKIYGGDDGLCKLSGRVQRMELKFHYRNGRKICTLADAIAQKSSSASTYQPMFATSQYNEAALPSSVTHAKYDSIPSQCAALVKSIELQLKAYPDELIGVVCPKNDAVTEVANALKATAFGSSVLVQSSQSGYMPFDPSYRICVTSMHSAKGLEFRAFHIVAAEGISNFSTQKNLAYTAVTRAKTSLSVYYSGKIPGYLEGALAALEPVKKPALKELFGGKK